MFLTNHPFHPPRKGWIFLWPCESSLSTFISLSKAGVYFLEHFWIWRREPETVPMYFLNRCSFWPYVAGGKFKNWCQTKVWTPPFLSYLEDVPIEEGWREIKSRLIKLSNPFEKIPIIGAIWGNVCWVTASCFADISAIKFFSWVRTFLLQFNKTNCIIPGGKYHFSCWKETETFDNYSVKRHNFYSLIGFKCDYCETEVRSI